MMDGGELPESVLDVLLSWPKHPVKDKFNDVHFFADVDKFSRELRDNKTEDEKICEIESSWKCYAQNLREKQ